MFRVKDKLQIFFFFLDWSATCNVRLQRNTSTYMCPLYNLKFARYGTHMHVRTYVQLSRTVACCVLNRLTTYCIFTPTSRCGVVMALVLLRRSLGLAGRACRSRKYTTTSCSEWYRHANSGQNRRYDRHFNM